MKGGYMSSPARRGLYALNVIIPLISGLFIYLTKAESTYLSRYLSGIRAALPVLDYPDIIRNHACDILWTFSLFFCLRLTLGERLKGKHNITVILVTGSVATVLEVMQLFKIIPGTFDMLDILAELTAAAAAFLITMITERRFV